MLTFTGSTAVLRMYNCLSVRHQIDVCAFVPSYMTQAILLRLDCVELCYCTVEIQFLPIGRWESLRYCCRFIKKVLGRWILKYRHHYLQSATNSLAWLFVSTARFISLLSSVLRQCFMPFCYWRIWAQQNCARLSGGLKCRSSVMLGH